MPLDSLFEKKRGERKFINIEKDVRVFRRSKAGSKALYSAGAIQKGETIQVGGHGEIETLVYDHKDVQCVPWTNASNEAEAEGICYIMIRDLPANW